SEKSPQWDRSAKHIVARLAICSLLMVPISRPAAAWETMRTADPVDPGSFAAVSVSDVTVAEGTDEATVVRFKVNIHPVFPANPSANDRDRRLRDRGQPGSALPITLSYRLVDQTARSSD